MNQKICIIGVEGDGADSLSDKIKTWIRNADLLMGGERHLNWFPEFTGEKLAIGSNLKEVAERSIAALKENRRVVVLASGDPLFYGIGTFLLKRLGKTNVEILPAVSAMQMAFARTKESWQEAALVSLHAKPMESLLAAIEEKKLVGLFTDDSNTPPSIARFLIERRIAGWRGWVCENLGGKAEKVTEMSLEEMAAGSFSELNVVILKKDEAAGQGAAAVRSVQWNGFVGIPDDLFLYRNPKAGLITKKEIRVISLAEMNLNARSTIWDIGAGSGSVSIESARVASEGEVFAVEKNQEDFDLIQANMLRFQVKNVTAVCKRAPDGLESFKDPDAVFIGGSGGEMGEILVVCSKRLLPGGRIVANLITLENSHRFMDFFDLKQWEVSYRLVQISRSKPILDMVRYEALNPITVATAQRKG